ncbi:MAG: hypothetical protein JEY91_16300 [Spirochaetaceae bacterium]|nr:hypothetical protein [Spirochaetaceae bacterium]
MICETDNTSISDFINRITDVINTVNSDDSFRVYPSNIEKLHENMDKEELIIESSLPIEIIQNQKFKKDDDDKKQLDEIIKLLINGEKKDFDKLQIMAINYFRKRNE